MRGIIEGIKYKWCRWFHRGTIKRDPLGRVNWQCSNCGRWSTPIPEAEEYTVFLMDMLKHREGK